MVQPKIKIHIDLLTLMQIKGQVLLCILLTLLLQLGRDCNAFFLSNSGGVLWTKGQFTWRKFSHQTKHFCCSSVFLLHDNGVLAPLKPQMFETANPTAALPKLMLMLAQVNGFRSGQYQTLIKHSTVH